MKRIICLSLFFLLLTLNVAADERQLQAAVPDGDGTVVLRVTLAESAPVPTPDARRSLGRAGAGDAGLAGAGRPGAAGGGAAPEKTITTGIRCEQECRGAASPRRKRQDHTDWTDLH